MYKYKSLIHFCRRVVQKLIQKKLMFMSHHQNARQRNMQLDNKFLKKFKVPVSNNDNKKSKLYSSRDQWGCCNVGLYQGAARFEYRPGQWLS